ncbi:uncharacterized protein C1orf131-like [Mya arenaria]|uniref:uncharacterized protein C1orf131-like n=1 Tax=Mya arenaria TaxID=6604 RepID=UPI0022E7FACD|nr:uncharacterized protein C1orf131-like [Mya arenaria]
MDKEVVDKALLQRLEEYGDSVVEGASIDKVKKKTDKQAKRNKSQGSSDTHNANTFVDTSSNNSRKKKKRRKKNKEKVEERVEDRDNEEVGFGSDVDEFTCSDDDKTGDKISGSQRQLKLLSKELGLEQFKHDLDKERRKKEEATQKTQGQAGKKKKEPEVIVFHSRRRKEKPEPSDQENTKRERPSREKIPRNEENPEFDLEMARFEVHKYGIAGFRGNEKEVAMTALLIKLGAKPPKSDYLNYKEYQEKRKLQMMEEKHKREQDRKMGLKVAKKDGGEKRKRDRNDIGPLDGQVGRWKAGVQIVHKDNIKGMKKSKIKH